MDEKNLVQTSLRKVVLASIVGPDRCKFKFEPTPGFRLQAPGFRLQALGSRLQTPGFRLQTSDSRL